jgi:Restriction endonuclease/FHA domain
MSIRHHSHDDLLMPGHRFEHEIGYLMEEFGYKVLVTPGSGDHGVDVIAEKNGRRVAVQVKLHTTGSCGNNEVLKLLGGMQVHKAEEGLFITTSKLTKKAKEACTSTGLVYYDHDRLLDFCEQKSLLLPSWTMLKSTSSHDFLTMHRDITIGRQSADSPNYINDQRMSRQHFRLTWEKLSLWIEDCKSTNGTLVEGIPIAQKRRLHYGSKISAGSQSWVISQGFLF